MGRAGPLAPSFPTGHPWRAQRSRPTFSTRSSPPLERSFDNTHRVREVFGATLRTMTPPATTAASKKTAKKKFEITQLDEVPAVKCPCGFSRRAFVSPDNPVATIHLVDIQTDAQTHYHKKLTEIYLI